MLDVIYAKGGKNFHLVHKSADVRMSVIETIRAAFEYQGKVHKMSVQFKFLFLYLLTGLSPNRPEMQCSIPFIRPEILMDN